MLVQLMARILWMVMKLQISYKGLHLNFFQQVSSDALSRLCLYIVYLTSVVL